MFNHLNNPIMSHFVQRYKDADDYGHCQMDNKQVKCCYLPLSILKSNQLSFK